VEKPALNPLNSHLLMFDGFNRTNCLVSICGNSIPWAIKGEIFWRILYVLCNSNAADVSD